MTHGLSHAKWLHRGQNCEVGAHGVTIETEPRTDLWQRTFYGFRVGNAPAAVVPVDTNVTFTVRANFAYRRRYDQAGVLIWCDEQNWFKASVEHEDETRGRLGSVLTTAGHSDWATRDVEQVSQAWWRLSRRGPDFLLQARVGEDWEQLRVFHMAALGPTDPEWGGLAADRVPAQPVHIGVYACSPEDSSFTASFDEISIEPSRWEPHA